MQNEIEKERIKNRVLEEELQESNLVMKGLTEEMEERRNSSALMSSKLSDSDSALVAELDGKKMLMQSNEALKASVASFTEAMAALTRERNAEAHEYETEIESQGQEAKARLEAIEVETLALRKEYENELVSLKVENSKNKLKIDAISLEKEEFRVAWQEASSRGASEDDLAREKVATQMMATEKTRLEGEAAEAKKTVVALREVLSLREAADPVRDEVEEGLRT